MARTLSAYHIHQFLHLFRTETRNEALQNLEIINYFKAASLAGPAASASRQAAFAFDLRLVVGNDIGRQFCIESRFDIVTHLAWLCIGTAVVQSSLHHLLLTDFFL